MEINGKTCYFYNTWITADIPEECKECDCNCNNDCKDCEICSAQGKCERDPDCCDSVEDQRVLYEVILSYQNASNYSGFSGCNQFGPASTRYTFCGNASDTYEIKGNTETYTTWTSKPDPWVISCGADAGFTGFPESSESYPYEPSTTVLRIYKNGVECSASTCPEVTPNARSLPLEYAAVTGFYPTTWSFRTGGTMTLSAVAVECGRCPDDPGA
jgi:hypothetical protein